MCGPPFLKQGKMHNNNEDLATKEALSLSFPFATIIADHCTMVPLSTRMLRQSNLPGSNYRRIICSCSYYMEHAKILLQQIREQIVLQQQQQEYAPGSYYRSILSSCSYYLEQIMLKMAKLEFENHKNQYFSWLLRSEQVKTNIFGNRMTKLTI